MNFEATTAPVRGLHTSHRHLVSYDVKPIGLGALDAVIVPATRTPTFPMPNALLAKELKVPLIALCSHDAHPDAIRDATSKWGVDVHAVDMRKVSIHPQLATTTVLQG